MYATRVINILTTSVSSAKQAGNVAIRVVSAADIYELNHPRLDNHVHRLNCKEMRDVREKKER